MKKVELKDVKPYAAPKHFNMTALRLHGKEETGSTKFWMGLSHFLPQGGAEFDASPTAEGLFRPRWRSDGHRREEEQDRAQDVGLDSYWGQRRALHHQRDQHAGEHARRDQLSGSVGETMTTVTVDQTVNLDYVKKMFDLTGKVAIVTGGAGALGEAIAQGLAAYGADVVVTGRTLKTLEQAVKLVKDLGRKALAVTCDVAKEEDVIVSLMRR